MSELFVRFPSTPGNHIATDDVNLLDCDSSWFAQGNGGLWTVGVPSTDQQKGDSPRSLLVAGGVSTSITPVDDGPDFSSFIYSAVGGDFDINGGTPVTVPSGTWTAVTNAGSAGTYTVSAASADDYYLAEVMLGDPTFVPSLRVVGDPVWETELAPVTWTPAGDQVISSTYDGGGSRINIYGFTDSIRLSARLDGATLNRDFPVPPGYVNGLFRKMRIRRDVSAGIDYLESDSGSGWEIDDQSGVWSPGLSLLPSNSPLNVGIFLEADMRSLVYRDGIDGPIVAQFDPADIVLP